MTSNMTNNLKLTINDNNAVIYSILDSNIYFDL